MSSTLVIEIPGEAGELEFNFRVESLPGRQIVYRGKQVGAVAFKADPGCYRWVAVAPHPWRDKANIKRTGTIYHGVDEKLWPRLKNLKPKASRATHGMRGVLWHCGFTGCNKTSTSQLAAVLHEAGHQGVDLLAAPERAKEAQEAVAVAAPKPTNRRGPGRPRKNVE